MICAVPWAFAVANPASTPATPSAELDHSAVPVTFFLLLSVYVASAPNWYVSPAATSAVSGVTATDTTAGAPTVTVRGALITSSVISWYNWVLIFAVICVAPLVFDVTSPLPSTDATAGTELDQIASSVTLLAVPSESVARAVYCFIAPSGTVVSPSTISMEVGMAGTTCRVAVSSSPPKDAVIVASPALRPFALPLATISATSLGSLVHAALCVTS